MKRGIAALCVVGVLSVSGLSHAATEPSLHEVYQAAQAGRFEAAQHMMDAVFKTHPNSGKAHYVEAEILSMQGRMAEAQKELATAERLAPGLPFTNPQSLNNLRSAINAPSNPQRHLATPVVMPIASTGASSFPWEIILVGLGLILAVIWFVRNLAERRVNATGGASVGQAWGSRSYVPNTPSYPSGYSPATSASAEPGIGSRIMGGLATGAAVGAGVVAGEALMHRLFDGNSHSPTRSNDSIVDATPDSSSYFLNSDMGGNDFGVTHGDSWDDTESSDWS